MNPVLAILIEAFGDTEGRRIWGAYNLAATIVQQREKPPEGQAPAQGEARPAE